MNGQEIMFHFRQGHKMFLFFKASWSTLKPTQPFVQGVNSLHSWTLGSASAPQGEPQILELM